MKVVDANVLIYAVNADSHHHVAARGWLDTALGAQEAVGLPWLSLLAFIRLTTNSVLQRPLAVATAMDIVDGWLAAPAVVVPAPTARHQVVLRDLLVRSGTAGNLTSDAHLAALALEHGATVCSFDRDFGRFAGLRWFVPPA